MFHSFFGLRNSRNSLGLVHVDIYKHKKKEKTTSLPERRFQEQLGGTPTLAHRHPPNPKLAVARRRCRARPRSIPPFPHHPYPGRRRGCSRVNGGEIGEHTSETPVTV